MIRRNAKWKPNGTIDRKPVLWSMPSMGVGVFTIVVFSGLILCSNIVYMHRRYTVSSTVANHSYWKGLETERGRSHPTLLRKLWTQGGNDQEQVTNNSRSSPPKQEIRTSEEQLKETNQKQGKHTDASDVIQQNTKDSGLDQRQETHQKELKQTEQQANRATQETHQKELKQTEQQPNRAMQEQKQDKEKDGNKSTSAHPIKVVASLPLCPASPPKLIGKLFVNLTTKVNLDDVVKNNPGLMPGGLYRPPDCQPRDKVAVVIPFRDREEHLRIFLHYMIPIFQRQLLQFKIYLIEQAGNCSFNRGMLINVGVLEAAKDSDWQCFCLHDVDLILEDDRNLYTCPEKPKHMSVAVDKFGYRLFSPSLFGGITIFTREQFWKINGFSNSYWGWGGEDDDLYKRVRNAGMVITRPDTKLARYKMIRGIHHTAAKENPHRFSLLAAAAKRIDTDGLRTTSYVVMSQQQHYLYTKITVGLRGHVNC